MNKDYQEIIRRVSGEIAAEFLSCEKELEKRAVLLDQDISEITRNIGSETTKIVLENILEGCVNKKNTAVL